jgi:extradiol dioxygenase family protein
MGHVVFHLAFPIGDVEKAKQFYVDGLGCELGRASASAVIFNFKGHQLVGHVTSAAGAAPKSIYPQHFGLVFTAKQDWQAFADRARAKALRFYQQPRQRYSGSKLEHETFFLEDPFHNLLEFKHYTHESAIFGEADSAQIGDVDAEE